MTKDKRAPKWSVMIPTFNCAALLEQTLKSVLAQDPGEDFMQIEVIDDCSSKDDPEKVVREIGKGRVGFYKQVINVGATKNFNTCINRAKGDLVHILHGDDWVANNFYREIENVADNYLAVGVFFTRGFIVDVAGEINYLSPRVPKYEKVSFDPSHLYYSNKILTPSIVLRKATYIEAGVFDERFVHVADWDMWIRAIKKCGVLAINKPLVFYRFFPENDTSKLIRSGENISDIYKFALKMQENNLDFNFIKFCIQLSNLAENQIKSLKDINDKKAVVLNLQKFKSLRFKGKGLIRVKRKIKQLRNLLRFYVFFS
jgi:glycosyltransferase involved in cell wall biosynthesis